MSASFDLDGYLARIGYGGPREPTLAVLASIHALHPAAIPFENLDPLLGRPVGLDLESLQAKMVVGRRGGYCFEQNGLLKAALEAIGFSVTGLAARVRWASPPEAPDGPRSHMALRVDLEEGAYIADVGFGGHIVSAPLALRTQIEQSAPASVLRFVGGEPDFTLQLRLPTGWRDVYRFTLEPQLAADYAVGSWFTATHPSSPFVANLLCERLTPERRLSLFNTRLTERRPDGTLSERTIGGPDELGETLGQGFAITLPAAATAIWERLSEPPAGIAET
jgi:N-hydroxyarylamine O-acetyltransferase